MHSPGFRAPSGAGYGGGEALHIPFPIRILVAGVGLVALTAILAGGVLVGVLTPKKEVL